MAGGGRCLCGSACVYIIALVVVSSSFGVVKPNHAGITIGTFNPNIDDTRVYTSGRYWTGPVHKFIDFPLTLQSVGYGESDTDVKPPLKAVVDGVECRVSASFQFRLLPTSIAEVYKRHTVNYRDKFVNYGTTVIQNTVARSTIVRLYTDRRNLTAQIKDALQQRFDEKEPGNLGHERAVEVTDVQLRLIALAEKTEQAIVNKLRREEEERTAQNNQFANQIRSGANVILGQANATVRALTAQRSSAATIARQEANAEATRRRIDAQTAAYQALKEELGFSNDQLLRYIWMRTLQEQPDDVKMVVGFDNPIIGL